MSLNTFDAGHSPFAMKEVHKENQTQEEIDQLTAEFKKKGGKIQVIEAQPAVPHHLAKEYIKEHKQEMLKKLAKPVDITSKGFTPGK